MADLSLLNPEFQSLQRDGAPLEWRRALTVLLPMLAVWALELTPMGESVHFPQLGYLGVHTVFEVLALSMGLLCFGLLWLTPSSARRTSTVALASAVAATAGLDLLHLLSYAGMPDMVTPSSPEKAIAFWLAGRLCLSMGLLVAAWAPTGRLTHDGQRLAWLGGMLGFAALASGVILWHPDWLPRTFVPGLGLTGLKAGIELGLALVNLSVVLRLRGLTRQLGLPATTLAVAAAFTAAAELCFATYGSPSDLLNGLGHVAKIASYVYLVRTAYLLALWQPLERAGGLADALEASASPTLICDAQGLIRWINPAFVRSTGFTLEDLKEQALTRLQREGDGPAWVALTAALAEGRPWQGHVRMPRRDGGEYLDDRRLTPIRDAQDHLKGFVMTGDDITERERQAHALATGEERMRALLGSAPDAVVVIDLQGQIQLVNQATERMFGYGWSELVGQNVRLLMPPSATGPHDEHLRQFVQSGQARIIGTGREVEGQHRDGHALQLHLTVSEALLPEGRVFIGFMRDTSEQRKAQQALVEREQRYRALMDTAMDGVFICDLEGRFLEVNDAYVQRSGYAREELLRLRIADLQAELATAEVADRIHAIVQQGHLQFESWHRSKQGQPWPVEISAAHWGAGDGQLFVFARDLTPRKAAERALRDSEERLALALRGANDGLWDYGFAERSLYLSSRWKEILGSPETVLPSTVEQVRQRLHPEDALRAHAAVADVLSGRDGDRFEVELRMRHQDGHWVPVLLRGQLVRDEDGAAVRMIGTLQDLTERRRAEQALRENEDKLRNLFELSPLGIALSTMDGRLVEFNEAFRRLTGYESQALKALSYWDLTPAEYARAEAEQLQAVAHTGRYGPYDKEYIRADGSRVPLRFNGVRIELAGQPYLWSIVEDLSIQRRMEAEREVLQQQQMQSQKLEALGHLTGGIAHDFNNMLAGIMGLASLGLERQLADTDGKLAQYLREIVRTSERGRDLVAKMLAYVRTEEAGPVQARDLSPVVAEICELLRSSLPSSIHFSPRCDAGVPPVSMSAVDMHQIVMNLVVNARDAIGQHGHIELSFSVQDLGDTVCTNCHQHLQGPCVVLEVRDDGLGISPDVLPKIFDPFFTTKEVGKGTGLGLASVIGLVHRAGGHMRVLTPPEGGTVMQVMLPPASTAPVPEPVPLRPVQLQGGESVWVVDDDAAVLVFLTELLRERGFEVTAFADPRKALEALQALGREGAQAPRPVALITDQTMPGMSGAELSRAVLAVLPGLPVVLCTGYSEHIDAESAQALGVRCFLRKPFDSQELLAALADVLPPQP